MSASTKTITVDHETASAHILAFAEEGRLEQGRWHGRGGDGREIACLLGSIDPRINSPEDCPANLMPLWLRRLTVKLFDGVPRDTVRHYGVAYGQSVRRWPALDEAAWERIRKAFIGEVFVGTISRYEAVGDAPKSALWAPIKAVSDQVLALLLRDAPWMDYRPLRDEAYRLRGEAWGAYDAAATRQRAAAAAAAVEAAVAAVAAAVAAVAAAAEVAAVVAAAAAAEVAAEVAEVEVEAVRRGSYAQSFDTLLKVIDLELEKG